MQSASSSIYGHVLAAPLPHLCFFTLVNPLLPVASLFLPFIAFILYLYPTYTRSCVVRCPCNNSGTSNRKEM